MIISLAGSEHPDAIGRVGGSNPFPINRDKLLLTKKQIQFFESVFFLEMN